MADTVMVGQTPLQINGHPNRCPRCHSHISPLFLVGRRLRDHRCQIVYQCPNSACVELFIADFELSSSRTPLFVLSGTSPISPVKRPFPKKITDLSSSFCEIYNEAKAAEDVGLRQICGVAYRKALEFLIKDYLIKKTQADASAIKKALLGKCISERVSDPKVKTIAERAVWLGNDEVHYERRWENKDLADLKSLIDLVLHWIEAEMLTEEMVNSMPK